MSSDPAAASPGASRPPVDVVRHAFERDHEIFFTAVETTRMPMIITDPYRPDNPIVFANRAFLEMTGYDRDEIVGHNCRFLQGADTDPQTVAEVREAVVEGRQVAVEILNYRKNGSSFWNALFISPVYDTAGTLAYFFASQLDVSRRRDAEDALRQAQKMEAIGQLTGGIAHDFNNILQIITGYLDVLESGLNKPTIDVERQRRGLGNMRAATDRAATLTQQLLAFARKQKLQGRTLNLNAMLDGMDALVTRTVGDKTSIERRLSSDLWNCRIDPTQAELAVLNILINARDAMTGSDARIVLTTANVTIEEGSAGRPRVPAPGRYVSLEIADSGPGIPPDILDRVMDPFFTTKEEGKGTGLGLSMVYGFAKQSGGAAHITCPPDGGTRVTILFPATSDAVGAPGKAVRLVGRQGSETILVVDDRRDIADLAADILDESGYRTHIAYGAAEALDLVARGEPIDLLFSDMIMPGTHSGVTLAREIRKRLPAIRVLLTTGYAEGSIEILDGGGQDFEVLPKPYKREDLLRKIRLVLDGPDGVS